MKNENERRRQADKPVKTLKDVLAEREPDAIDNDAWGGVYGCPSQYPFLNVTKHDCPRLNTNYSVDFELHGNYCAACWNRPYKPVNEEG